MPDKFAPEKHLVITWPNCGSNQIELAKIIHEKFEVLRVISGEWTESNAELNYSRFYQQNLSGNLETISHKGIGKFQIYIVLDSQPSYGFRETSRGFEFVNINIFSLKSRLREMTLGGHKVHSTNSFKEFRRDVAMLWGIDVSKTEDFENLIPENMVGTFGSEGFKNIEDAFLLLNSCTDYLVLRNYEEILDLEKSLHPDIDLLVSNVERARLVLNAEPISMESYRVNFKNNVNGNETHWDLRSPADKYMDYHWAIELMNSRTEIRLDKLNLTIFGLNDLDYYFSLAYHALVHKMEVSQDYILKLSKLTQNELHPKLENTETLIDKLSLYMANRNFQVTKPIDLSVFFNDVNVNKINASRSLNVFTSFHRNIENYLAKALSTEFVLKFHFVFECAHCRKKHFCLEIVFKNSSRYYYGSQLSNDRLFLISLENKLSISNFFTFTKTNDRNNCRGCLESLDSLNLTALAVADSTSSQSQLIDWPIFLFTKYYVGKSVWQGAIFGLVNRNGNSEMISILGQIPQNHQEFSIRAKREEIISGVNMLELCVDDLKLGLVSRATNTFLIFYDHMATIIESNDENIDLNISNLICVGNTYFWVDEEIFGNVKKISIETVTLRNLIVSLVLILQADCPIESKKLFLKSVFAKLEGKLTDVDFKKYLDFEFALQSTTRVLDYEEFTEEQSDFFHYLMKGNFSRVLEDFRYFDLNHATSKINILENNLAEIQSQKSKILSSYTWKFGKFFNLLITNPMLLSKTLIKSTRNLFI